jgi:hypothetical protein
MSTAANSLVAPVEEAVRRSRVGNDLVLDPGGAQRLVELRVHLGGDVLVVAGLEGEDRGVHLPGTVDRPRKVAPSRLSVEADGPFETVPAGRGQPGVAAAEAEADGEHRTGTLAAEPVDGSANVGLNLIGRALLDVRHVVEVVTALPDAGSATEVVDGDSGDTALGEAQRELLVKAVEPAHVGEDDDADVPGLFRQSRKGRESRAVGALELEVTMVDRAAHDRRDRRHGVELEAHGATLARLPISELGRWSVLELDLHEVPPAIGLSPVRVGHAVRPGEFGAREHAPGIA